MVLSVIPISGLAALSISSLDSWGDLEPEVRVVLTGVAAGTANALLHVILGVECSGGEVRDSQPASQSRMGVRVSRDHGNLHATMLHSTGT